VKFGAGEELTDELLPAEAKAVEEELDGIN
jgi:hypothetical protein